MNINLYTKFLWYSFIKRSITLIVFISNLLFKINQEKLPEIIHVGWWVEVRTHFSLILHVRLQNFWKKQNLKGYYMYSIKWQSHSRKKKFKRIWKFGKKKIINTCIVIIPFELYKYSSSYSSLIIKVTMFLIIVSATLLNSLNKTNTY